MNCREFEDHLEELLEGELPAAERLDAERHREACDRCRELAELACVDLPPGGGGDDPELTAAILRRTGGPACEAARDRIPDRVDGVLSRADGALLESHLDHCDPCRALSEALAWATEELPAMAEVHPGPWFVGRVLQATSARRPLSWVDRARGWWEALLRRPRLAWEAPYVGAMALLMLFGSPVSPMRDVPAQALAIVSANPVRVVQESPIPEIGPRLATYTSAAWGATGGKLWESTRPMRGVYQAQLGRVWEHGRALGVEVGGLWASFFAGDMDASADRLHEIGRRLRAMWIELTRRPVGEGAPGKPGDASGRREDHDAAGTSGPEDDDANRRSA